MVEERQISCQRMSVDSVVAHDAMQRQEQDVRRLAQPEEGAPEQRASAEIERPLRLDGGQPPALGLPLALGQLPQVHHRQRHGRDRMDDRCRPPVDAGVGRAQDLVAAHDRGEALP